MLNVENLSCRRGGRAVFTGISFAVESGGMLLVAGANGSGKSSLLRCLAGLTAPDGGAVSWDGGLHYVGHLDALKPALTVAEMLDYWRALRGLSGSADCLDAFGLGRLADRPVRSLSAGQKRRLSLTRLLLDPAPLWLLDEPATALDKDGQVLLNEHIARHRAGGGIVIAASHDEMNLPDMRRLEMARGR